GGGGPGAQARDHVGAHARAHLQPGGGAAAPLRRGDILGVGGLDRRPRRVGGQVVGEGFEEARDLRVRDLAHRLERLCGGAHRGGGGRLFGGGDVQQVAAVLHDNQAV